MTVRIPEIGDILLDHQHDNLVAWFERLEQALRDGVADTLVDQILANVGQYVEEHFAYEEAVMKRVGYPEAESHCREHRQFRDRLEELERARAAGEAGVSAELAAALKAWIVAHISRSDAAFGNHLQALSASI